MQKCKEKAIEPRAESVARKSGAILTPRRQKKKIIRNKKDEEGSSSFSNNYFHADISVFGIGEKRK